MIENENNVPGYMKDEVVFTVRIRREAYNWLSKKCKHDPKCPDDPEKNRSISKIVDEYLDECMKKEMEKKKK